MQGEKLTVLGWKKKKIAKNKSSYSWNEILESEFFSSLFPADLALQWPSSRSLGDLSAVTFHCLPSRISFQYLAKREGKRAMSKTLQNGGISVSVHTLRIYKLQKRVSYFQRPQIFIVLSTSASGNWLLHGKRKQNKCGFLWVLHTLSKRKSLLI